MNLAIRIFLLVEVLSLLLASSIHLGVLLRGYDHQQAGIAESAIGVVLLLALGLTLVREEWTRSVGVAAQAFGLLGTLLGAVMIAIGVGPRTIGDILYHIALLTTLVFGLVIAVRARPPQVRQSSYQ